MRAQSFRDEGRISVVSDRMFFLLLTLPILFLYVLTQTNTMSPAHDSMCYLRMIEQGEYFHSHHLLYNAAAALWTSAWQAVLPSLSAIRLIAWLNGVFGALSMGVFAMLLVRRANLSRSFAVAATLLPVFSFGVWFYSVTIEVYIIALFFVLTALYVLTSETLATRKILAAAVLHGIAMLFHQLHLFFLVPAIVIIVGAQRRKGGSVMSAWKPVLQYTVVAGLVALIPYLIVGIAVLGMDTPEKYVRWILGYGTRSDFWHEPGLSLLPKIALGYGRSVVGADFLFALQPTLELIQRLLPSKWLADQEFVVRRLPDWLAIALIVFSVAFAAVFTTALWKAIRAAFRFRAKLPRLFWSALALLLTYSLFFAFWDTTNVEFWIPQSVMVWLLLSLALHTRLRENTVQDGMSKRGIPTWRHRIPVFLPLLAGLLFILNGAGSILWMIPSSNDYYMTKTERLQALAGDDGMIVLPDPYMMDWYLSEASLTRTISFSAALRGCDEQAPCAFESLSHSIDSAMQHGARIVLDGHLIKPTSAIMIRGGDRFKVLLDAFRERYGPALQEIPTPVGPMYQLDPLHLRSQNNSFTHPVIR